jgi:hypothetical protein
MRAITSEKVAEVRFRDFLMILKKLLLWPYATNFGLQLNDFPVDK